MWKPSTILGIVLGVGVLVMFVPIQPVVIRVAEVRVPTQPQLVMDYPTLVDTIIKKLDSDGNEVHFSKYKDQSCIGGIKLERKLTEKDAIQNCALHQGCQSITCIDHICSISTPTCVLVARNGATGYVAVARTPKKMDLYGILKSKLRDVNSLKINRRVIQTETHQNNFKFDNLGKKWKHNYTRQNNSEIPYIYVTDLDFRNMRLGCVDPIHKIVFFRTPKVQSSNLLRLYDRLVGHTDIIHDLKGIIPMHSLEVENDSRRQRICFKYLKRREVNLIMNDPSFKKVIFFRDPMERLLSCFLDKFLRLNFSQFFGQEQGKTTFSELVEYISRSGPPPYGVGPGVDYHYRAQILISHIFKFLPLFDFIGWGENQHTRLMLERYDLWESYGAKTWKNGFMVSGDKHSTGSTQHYNWYFNSTRIQNSARAAYAIDYHFFDHIGLRSGGPPVSGGGAIPHTSVCSKLGCAPGEPIL